MVDKLKYASKVTGQTVEVIYELFVVAALVAAVIKLATQPKVHSGIGLLPVWQVVAGVILAGIVVREYKLRIK